MFHCFFESNRKWIDQAAKSVSWNGGSETDSDAEQKKKNEKKKNK